MKTTPYKYIGTEVIQIGRHGNVAPGNVIHCDAHECKYMSENGVPPHLVLLTDEEAAALLAEAEALEAQRVAQAGHNTAANGAAAANDKPPVADPDAQEVEIVGDVDEAEFDLSPDADPDEIPPYEQWTPEDLIAECENRGIDRGKKTSVKALAALLSEDDEKDNPQE